MKKKKMKNEKMYVKIGKGTVENERAKMKTKGWAGCCDSFSCVCVSRCSCFPLLPFPLCSIRWQSVRSLPSSPSFSLLHHLTSLFTVLCIETVDTSSFILSLTPVHSFHSRPVPFIQFFRILNSFTSEPISCPFLTLSSEVSLSHIYQNYEISQPTISFSNQTLRASSLLLSLMARII